MIFHNNEHQCVMAEFHYESQEMVPIGPTAVRSQHSTGPAELYVPGGVFHFVAGGVEIEGGAGSGVDVQWPWEPHPQRRHDRALVVGAMIVDKHPVTNADYAAYLDATHYRPSDTARWLEQNFEGGRYGTFRLNFHPINRIELGLRGHTHVWGANVSRLRLKLADMVLI